MEGLLMALGQGLPEWLAAERDAGRLSPHLAEVFAACGQACREIAMALRSASLLGNVGPAGETNVQGEAQKKLDVIANDIFMAHASRSRVVALLVSEELEDLVAVPDAAPEAGLALVFDPLDGSSNLDINGTVGSIFSVLDVGAGRSLADVLQPGRRQRAAGYALYGPATSLVLTTGRAVDIFTLDDAGGEFRLTAAGARIPRQSAEYAINAARVRQWYQPVRDYVDNCLAGETGPYGQRYNMRWAGAMVADIHRVLSRGGIFLYPEDEETKTKGGRLRLLYEANPMGMIVEAAGGRASTGLGPILDVEPTALHQRISVILGSSEEVERVEALYRVSAA